MGVYYWAKHLGFSSGGSQEMPLCFSAADIFFFIVREGIARACEAGGVRFLLGAQKLKSRLV